MKTSSLLIFAIPLLLTACKTKCVNDTGVKVKHEKVLEKFDELEVRGPIKVILRQDSSYKVVIAADSAVVDVVNASVGSNTLKLKLDPEKYCGSDSIIVYAGVKLLKEIRLESGSKLASEGLINLRDVEFKLDGNTEVNMDMSASKMTTNVDGTANITLRGQVGEHIIKSKGAFTLNAFDFIAGKYTINTEGVNKAKINVLNDLNIETSGTSDIQYKGSPKNINKKKTGNAILEKVN